MRKRLVAPIWVAFGLVAALLLPITATAAPAYTARLGAEVLPGASPTVQSVEGLVTPDVGSVGGGDIVTVTVDAPPSITSSAHGDGFGLAVTDQGDVASWGAGTSGQLGDGQFTDSFTPILLTSDAFGGEDVAEVAAGGQSAYALTSTGNLYAWGATNQVGVPTLVTGLPLDGAITQLVASRDWAYLLTDVGTLIGLQDGASPVVLVDSAGSGAHGGKVVEVSASSVSVIARTDAGEVWTASTGSLTAEGFSPLINPDSPQSEPANLIFPFAQVVAGEDWFAGLTSEGDVYAWGGVTSPMPTGLSGVQQIASSGDALASLHADGQVTVWQFGGGSTVVDLGALAGAEPVSVTAGDGAFFVLAGGSLFGWGNGGRGQLGTGIDLDEAVPSLSVSFWPDAVSFGAEVGQDFSANSRSSMSAQAPPSLAGSTDVTVSFALRSGQITGDYGVERVLPDAFTFEEPEEPATPEEPEPSEPASRPAPQARSAGISPMALGDPAAPKDPKVVWTETFDQPPAQTWANNSEDTGSIANYKGVPPNILLPVLGSTWGDISNCVGIRTNYDAALPNVANPILGNGSYCGRITHWLGSLDGRRAWWNGLRTFALALAKPGSETSNNIAGFVTNATVSQTNVGSWNQTAVYQTGSMNLVDPPESWPGALGWTSEVSSRFYSGSIDVASMATPGTGAPLVGVRIFPVASNQSRGVELWPFGSRINPTMGATYNGELPSPFPSGQYVRFGSYTAPANGLFTREEAKNFGVKVTNDNGHSAGNDFAFDNITLLDVTPTLHKAYVAPNAEVYGTDAENKRVRVYPDDEASAHLVFTVTNTTDYKAKAGWGFTETLPTGLTTAGSATFNGCGVNPTVLTSNPGTGNSTITVSGGTTNAGASNAVCTISVPVTSSVFSKFDSPGTATGGVGTSNMVGVQDPNAASIEFWQFDLGKTAELGEADVNGAANDNSDARVNPGDIVTYTVKLGNPSTSSALVFGEAPAGNPKAGEIWVGAAVTDFLADVLDDAELLGTNGDPIGENGAPKIDVTVGEQPSTVVAASFDPGSADGSIPAQPQITMTGTVPIDTTVDVTFKVKVKPNDEEAQQRLAGWQRGSSSRDDIPSIVGYQLNNYVTGLGVTGTGAAMTPLLPASCPPQIGFFSEQANACTRTQIRAWTVEKQSMPTNGEEIHSGGKVYYRVHITNISGDAWTGVQITDDLTDVLSKAQWVTAPTAAWGIEFRDEDGELVEFRPGVKTDTSPAPTPPYPDIPGDPIKIWPEFKCEDGTDPTNCKAPYEQAESGYLPWTSAASWTLNAGPFDIPADVKTVVVGYIVRAGYAAAPDDPRDQYLYSYDVSAPSPVRAAPSTTVTNIVGAAKATPVGSSGTPIAPNRCAGIPLKPTEDLNGVLDCSTTHQMAESFFHIRKHGTANGEIVDNVAGAQFLIADTYADALAGLDSKWLCHTANNPCGTGGVVVDYAPPEQGTEPPAPSCSSGSTGSHVDPGEPRETLGDPDFGAGSATHLDIVRWNAAANVYNTFYAAEIKNDGLAEVPLYPLCGLFYEHTHADAQDAGDVGSWHVQDLKGGETTTGGEPAENWRSGPNAIENGSAPVEKQGTYWLMETSAPGGYQLLAQPQQMWVAPGTMTPSNLNGSMTDPDPLVPNPFYNYQGRVSLPHFGVGETNAALAGIRTRCDAWCQAPVPDSLPPDNQPACVCNNGWNLHVFDVQMQKLPLSGGMPTWAVVATGGSVFLLVAGAAVWRRRRPL